MSLEVEIDFANYDLASLSLIPLKSHFYWKKVFTFHLNHFTISAGCPCSENHFRALFNLDFPRRVIHRQALESPSKSWHDGKDSN